MDGKRVFFVVLVHVLVIYAAMVSLLVLANDMSEMSAFSSARSQQSSGEFSGGARPSEKQEHPSLPYSVARRVLSMSSVRKAAVAREAAHSNMKSSQSFFSHRFRRRAGDEDIEETRREKKSKIRESAVALPSLWRVPQLRTNRLHFGLFLGNIILVLVCYNVTVCTPAGGLDDWDEYRPDCVSIGSGFGYAGGDEEEPQSGTVRVTTRACSHCTRPKPPRVHHCRICNSCVLRMDHHCVWVVRCIGYRNHKVFIQFLFYTVLATAYALAIKVRFLIHFLLASGSDVAVEFAAERLGVMIALIALAAPVTIGSFIGCMMLLGWQLYLAARNLSSVEHFKLLTGSMKTNPYDTRSTITNLKHLLGPNPLLWLVPTPIRRGSRRMR
ncbi:putative protein S-acyltransferase 15 [Porphyridium purpureum]|uniref:Palmitoyltransferase n=1 Tax=Porphyridium purpureum TaxID=35688 RepID=A0A5J4Z8Z3_PORPP|nr:putative protein S-acyltransferase 15 [Porphyridium purpureum]|eukprot:POR2025..scf295_1